MKHNRQVSRSKVVIGTAKETTPYRKLLNPNTLSGLVHPYQLVESISNFRDLKCFYYYYSNRNSVDSDQMPHSDLGLHCLPMSQKGNARYKWVNNHNRPS